MHVRGRPPVARITRLIEAGIIKLVIDRVFPLTATGEAMHYVEKGTLGKVVIRIP
ncbi:Unknown protein sequence [Pseudomonas amygdali pv. dendropanacis]|uniref:Uncharacterized protein n=1 Tax=Pseudomonas amygdali pv. dendropanacis TaxID=235272 RepID=A0A0P9Q7W5_PSEA0|nr:Unknown protein sequence [Pseudomonas amygdali pv. dendropanacis]